MSPHFLNIRYDILTMGVQNGQYDIARVLIRAQELTEVIRKCFKNCYYIK